MNVIVFAPHEDDEAFACAGTIAKHKLEGDAVSIVFMTDGRLGVNKMIEGKYTPDQLAQERKKEALAAAKAIGVPKNDVIFLGYHDQDLANHHDEAIQRIGDLVKKIQPTFIYQAVTNYGHVDHLAMFFFVFEAAKSIGFTGEIRVSKPMGLLLPAKPPTKEADSRMELVEKDFKKIDSITIDISRTFETKIAAGMAHKTQLGMFWAMVDPKDDFESVVKEGMADIFQDKVEVFERRVIIPMPAKKKMT
nr:PIG-L deacetylase family protein [Candidatus Sigynarchaeota archaeon]